MKNKLLLILFICASIKSYCQYSERKVSSRKTKPVLSNNSIFVPSSSFNRTGNIPNNAAVIYSQDFSLGIPSNWTIIDNAGLGEVFTWTTTGSQTTPDSLLSTGTTAYNGYVIFDSDGGGTNGAENCDMITSSINCLGHSTVYLSMNEYFLQYAASTGTISVSIDGINFSDVYYAQTNLTQNQTSGNPHYVQIDISSIAANQPNVYIKFKWTGDYDWWWMFDDVTLFEPNAIDGGVVSSNLVSGCSLSSVTPVTITINNYGGATLTNIPVSFSVNGGTAISEIAPGPIAPNGTYDYTFTATANLSTSASSTISFATSLIGDANTSNDSYAVTVDNFTPVNLSSPYIMDFEPADDLSAWKILDGNGDGATWGPVTTLVYSGTQAIRKVGSGSADDDWMWSRCLDMEVGQTYKLEYWYRQFDLTAPCSLEVKLATAQNVVSSTQLIAVEAIDTIYHLSSNTFTVPSNGSYYIAWHAFSNAGSSSVRVDLATIKSNCNIPPPTPTINANGPLTFCNGGSVTLISSSPTGNTWSNGSSAQSITVTNSGSYSVTASNGTCTATSQPTIVSVISNPIINTQPISQAVNPNTTVQFTASSVSPGISYQWQVNNGAGFTNIANGGQYSGANSSTLTITNVLNAQNNYQFRCVVSNSSCNVNSNAATLTVYCLAPAVNLAGSNTFCQGTLVNLFAANGSGYTYQWYRNGSIIAGATTANYAATIAGNYSVRIDSGGCYGISPAQTVSFYSLPNIGISNSAGTVVCSGSPVTLNGTGAVSYSWNNGVLNNTTFYPTSTNTYQVIGTDIHGCTNSNSTTIVVNGLPTVQSIIGNPSIVPFQSYVYGVNASPGISFNWIIQGGFIQSGQGTNSISVIWGSTGPYLLQLVQNNANGCSNTSSLAVINSNCSITYTVQQFGTAPYCQGDSITLSVATAPGTQFQWLLNGAPINNATGASVIATQSGVYQVQMTQSGCTALSNGNSISFLQAPATPVITASTGGSGCLGGTQTLTCATGYNGYIWSNGASTNSTVANNSGNYLVTVTGANGCEATSAPYFVNLSLLSSADICLVSVDDVTNKNVVIWEKPVLTGVDSFYVYKEATTNNVYTKIGSVAANAFSTFTDNNSNPLQRADRYKISILDTCGFESAPSTIHKTIHLSINQGVGTTYNLIWDAYEGFVFGTYYILRGTNPNNLVTIDSIQSSLLSYTDLNPPAGTIYYAVEVRKAIACNPTARTSSLGYVSSRSNIKDNTLSSLNYYTNPFNSFTIVPNPATESTAVNINLSNSSVTNISVFDMTGRLVQLLNNSALTAGSHTFTWDLNENNAKAKAGVYFIKVSANGYSETKRVVVL